MKRGWFKLWRRVFDPESPFFGQPNLFYVACWCMRKAGHTENTLPLWGGRTCHQVRVGPGQFVFGRNQAAEEMGLPPSTIRNCMDRLERLEVVDRKVDKHWTVVTIRNWETYQGQEDGAGQQTGQAKDKRRTGVGHKEELGRTMDNTSSPSEKRERAPKFVPPTIEDVTTYAQAEHIGTPKSVRTFHNHFTSNGWRVSGKAPMKDWKASYRNWVERETDFVGITKPTDTGDHRKRLN